MLDLDTAVSPCTVARCTRDDTDHSRHDTRQVYTKNTAFCAEQSANTSGYEHTHAPTQSRTDYTSHDTLWYTTVEW